jgi:hypothetical protein
MDRMTKILLDGYKDIVEVCDAAIAEIDAREASGKTNHVNRQNVLMCRDNAQFLIVQLQAPWTAGDLLVTAPRRKIA